jgi:glycosyltransferase involved in cell wall biosynthesis
MRVWIISTAHDARDDRLYYKEARSLAKEHEVTIVAPLLREPAIWEDRAIKLVRLDSGLKKTDRLKSAIRLVKRLSLDSCDVLHVVDYELMPFLALFRWRTGAKIVYDVWEANYELIADSKALVRPLRVFLAAVFDLMEKRMGKYCDLLLTADAAIAGGFGKDIEATVIYNYPLLSALLRGKREGARLQVEFRENRCIIYQGTMDEERGVLAAVDAMALVHRAHPEATLLLVGRMPERLGESVREKVVRHGLEGAVRCMGWVDHTEVGNYLAISEIGLVPFDRTRKFEKNIPQKIFEYWAAGIPVVATDLGPVRQFMGKCRGGILTKKNDPVLLSNAICALLDQPMSARAMGERGRAMVEADWRWEIMEQRLLEAYRDLGAGRSSGQRFNAVGKRGSIRQNRRV